MPDGQRAARRQSVPRITRRVLQQLIHGAAEPQLLTRVDRAAWPVVLANPALEKLAERRDLLSMPVADLVEALHGRDAARELSAAIRTGGEISMPVEARGRNWLLVLQPIAEDISARARFCAVFWREGSRMMPVGDTGAEFDALLRARRQLRDLSRDDPVTGLLNEKAFFDVLAHDWAVAARQRQAVALIAFRIDDFAAYRKVFGGHAADTCLRQVAQTIRRSLRRASDVATRLHKQGEEVFVVLCQATDRPGLEEFAGSVADKVRKLGLHHPHASKERFVTVSFRSALRTASGKDSQVWKLVERLCAGVAD